MSDVNQAAIAFSGARVDRGARTLVGPLDLQVGRGETVVLLGRSGSGKTTTLRLANGLVRPTAGRVLVEGRDVAAADPVRLRRSMGYVIQEIGLFPHMSVARNIGVVPRLEGWDDVRVARRVAELLELVGLPAGEFGRRLPHQLSGGQRQRVGVARALAADPPTLLCDEPFGAVDPITRADLQREFRALTRQLGKTVLFVTHDVREALALADRLVVLEDGRIHFAGDAAAFRASPDPVVAAFRALVA